MKRIKPLILILIAAGVLTTGLYFLGLLAFTGVFDKKYSREELVKEFKEHEKEFADLEAFFISKVQVPMAKRQKVSFGLGKGKKISLDVFPTIISPAHKVIGGSDVETGSSKLDSALQLLGWTSETLDTLRDKLSKTNCDWITTTDTPNKVILLYPDQSGWGSFTYAIYDKPIADSLVTIYGAPLSNSDFGKRVVLSYHAAL